MKPFPNYHHGKRTILNQHDSPAWGGETGPDPASASGGGEADPDAADSAPAPQARIAATQQEHQQLALFTPSDLVESAACLIIDPARPTECARAAFLALLLSASLKPPTLPLLARAGRRAVLDLACGPGDWAREIAQHNPRCEVTGVDRCQAMIEHASSQAARQQLGNVSFSRLDVLTQPLPFPDQRFDLINAQFLASCLSGYDRWRPLMRDCVRLLKPGGTIRLVECVEGQANSPACHLLCIAYQQALLQAGLHPALWGHSPQELMFWLDGLLFDAGCHQIDRQVTRIVWQAGKERWTELNGYLLLTLRQVQPFLLGQGVISADEFERAYRELGNEIAQGSFAGHWLLQVSTGTLAHKTPAPPARRVSHWQGGRTTQPAPRADNVDASKAMPDASTEASDGLTGKTEQQEGTAR